MEPDDFIKQSIDRGERLGLHALSSREQVVFAIAEAEVYCDMEGIDSLLARYGKTSMDLFARAFLQVGAFEVAAAFQSIADAPGLPGEAILSEANGLITERRGYSHDEIASFVARGG